MDSKTYHVRSIFIVFLVILSTNVFSQDKVYFDADWKETSKENAQYYRTVEASGGQFLVKDFFMDGRLQFKSLSKSNKEPLSLEGEAIWYNEDGSLAKKGFYKDDKPHGDVTTHYSNGELKSEEKYVLGELNGVYTEYFPNGEISNQANFVAHKIHGLHTKYSSPNQLEFKLNYKKGVMDGPYEIYTSSGDLFHQGSAKDGVQDGKCTNYYFEGQLRKTYTIKDKKLHGKYIEYTSKGDVSTTGEFEDGKVVSFESKSLRTTNNSKFSSSMYLKNGIEHWEIFRDGILIVKSFYKEGLKTGKWEVYNYDGSELYQTITFDKNSTCKETYLQTTKEKFDPFLFLSTRFSQKSENIEIKSCEGFELTQLSEDPKPHPFYYYRLSEKPTEKKKPAKDVRTSIIDYKESGNTQSFLSKNKCVTHPKHKSVTVCTRDFNSIMHSVFLSEDLDLLKKLRSNANPADNEMFFYYQKFEEREYDLDQEETPNRYMGFKIPKILIEAFKTETLDDLSVIRVYEHEFWDVSNFSGMSAYRAFKEEVDK